MVLILLSSSVRTTFPLDGQRPTSALLSLKPSGMQLPTALHQKGPQAPPLLLSFKFLSGGGSPGLFLLEGPDTAFSRKRGGFAGPRTSVFVAHLSAVLVEHRAVLCYRIMDFYCTRRVLWLVPHPTHLPGLSPGKQSKTTKEELQVHFIVACLGAAIGWPLRTISLSGKGTKKPHLFNKSITISYLIRIN